ncbi:putative Protein-lysine N-methyltransferase efm4 [Blattamonas nauphoetae]|uniref:Protein-lysine N-methyltransferase BLNAU_15974 n=1 Tax=Blattamonas nauphoetae TaxID=2049346 RepID=A0ABQ9X981_9EUKA|nr:putative Protein-lysine N-methyltransferase efm4 [Blattamonas nauphoetae]
MSEEDSDTFRSPLGTKQHWDEVYQLEINNFEDHGDIGEVWFGEQVQRKVIRYISETLNVPLNTPIFDIGTGNGAFLFALAEEGYHELFGSDYSEPSVNFCRIQQATFTEDKTIPETAHFTFFVSNFLEDDAKTPNGGNFYSVIHDKGTYDAIHLDPDIDKEKYYTALKNCLAPGGVFAITSCNWTEDELIAYFVRQDGYLKELTRISNKTFSFGGKEGNTVSTVLFKRE